MDAYPQLTRGQELIVLGEQIHPGSARNNMAFAFTFKEPLDPGRMQRAFAKLIAASDALRMTFDGQQLTVAAAVSFTLPIHDFRGERDPDQCTRDWVANLPTQPLNLAERLFDAALFLQPETTVLYLNQHHLITDGWGYSVQVRYLLAAYAGAEVPPTLPSFAEYVRRAAAEKRTDATVELAEAWKRRVATYPSPPLLYGRNNASDTSATDRFFRQLTQQETDRLRAALAAPDVRAWTEDLALYNVLLTALFVYLARVSGQYDLVVGAPAHNRMTKPDQQTPGLFMELFPLRAQMSPEDTLGDVLEKVKIAALTFLREARPGTSSAATGRSFNVLLNFINRPFHDGHQPVKTEWLHPGTTEPGHHLKVQVYDFDASGRLTFSFDFNRTIVGSAAASQAIAGFMGALWQVVDDRTILLHQLPEADRNLLGGFEQGPQQETPSATVLELIERQVAASPDTVAVQFREKKLSYAELDRRADKLAVRLHEAGVGREDVVPLCIDRSLEMMVGLLGILKVGAAYLPIDPSLPTERIRYLGQDAGAKVYVADAVTQGKLMALDDLQWVVIGTGEETDNPAESSLPSHLRPRPSDLMYVLYTSGSTGQPKGVMNQHDGVANRLIWHLRTLVGEDQRPVVLQKTTFTFDVSVWELFLPLICGGAVVMAEPGGEKDADYLRRAVREYGVTMLHFVPPMLELFLTTRGDLPTLQRVVCSGEALLPQQAKQFYDNYPKVDLTNLYGPTEAAIDVTHYAVPRRVPPTIPIGQPIANVRLRIYGERGELLPPGRPGELYLGGVQVARGYLNRPELTAEKFVEHDGQRWYRTGDLVRWLPDGNLEFLGRIDHQVKLRGFRIELGEIEARLSELPGVGQATVVLRKDAKGEPALIAYAVGTADPADLGSALREQLPGYMVPSSFQLLSALPLLPNGKIDRKALPEPVFDLARAAAGDPPRGEFEEMLHAAWTDIFDLEAIGRSTHFLDLGGHSLTGIRLVNRINADFELELPVTTVFRYPTIAAQAEHIERTIRALLAATDDG